MERVIGVDKVVAVVVGFWEEEESSKEIGARSNCAQPPEPLEGEFHTDPAVNDRTTGGTSSKEKGVDGHLGTTFMKEKH